MTALDRVDGSQLSFTGDQWKVVDRFDTSYYNGLDVRVMLGEFVLAEVVGLSYEVMEQATPIYGYASYTFKQVVRGTRLIRGQFTINFKQSGYIVWLVNRYKALQSGDLPTEEFRRQFSLSALRAGETNLPAIRQDIQRAVELSLKSRSDELTPLIEALRTHFWGESAFSSNLSVSYAPLFSSGDVSLRLLIAYGDPQLKDSRGLFLQKPLPYPQGRSVLSESNSRAELFQAEELVDVHIAGYSKAIDDSGRNLLEQYQFFAKDILFWQRPE